MPDKSEWLLTELKRSETLAEVPRSCCCLQLRSAWSCSLLCAWLPWIFFRGAGNVLGTCERPELSAWLKIFSLVSILAPATTLTLLAGLNMIGLRCSKEGSPISAGDLSALHFLAIVAMAAYGWYLYIGSSAESCDGAGPFKPHLLLFVTLLVVTVVAVFVGSVGFYFRYAPRTLQADYQPPPWGGYL